ncbi:MAG: xylulokinase [Chloroflexi bacterium]|nr:xylulokinase [Chloroflexota bacterium]MCC6891568.1 xylulokinase [Anaerolineae bacterium]
MSKYFLGVDTSTTASKALAVDSQGNVIVIKGNPHELSTPRPLWSEQDPEDWWQAASKSIREVVAEVGADNIAAIGLTGQMHGLTSLDKDGKPVRPAILWNDQRSAPQCAEVTEKVGAKRLYQIIGSLLLAGFTAPKILWVRQNEPEVYNRIAHVLLPKDYIRYRLSGAFVCDVADACGFGCMDVGKRTWSDEVLAAFEIPRAWLPELCESQEVCATVNEEAAAITGLKVGTPIVGGAGDQPASGVGNGIVTMNQASLTVGTSGVAYAANDRYAPEPDGRLHTFCGPIPGTWFHMGVMLSAAGGLRWLHDELAPNVSYDDLNKHAESVPRGSLGLLFAPYLTGERNPHPDPFARGAFVGFTLRHGLPHMIRAVMEGVSFGMRDELELLRSLGVNPSEAVIAGGLVNSPVWLQLTTDIMGIPLYTINTGESSAFGAAILAAVGAGAHADVPTACANMIRRVDTVQPDTKGTADYQRLYPAFRALYPALKETYATLAQFED